MSVIISIVVLSLFGIIFAAMAFAPLAMDGAHRHPATGVKSTHTPISIASGRGESAATFERTAAERRVGYQTSVSAQEIVCHVVTWLVQEWKPRSLSSFFVILSGLSRLV